MQYQEVTINQDELPYILQGPEYREGLPFIRRIAQFLMGIGILVFLCETLIILFGPDRLFISEDGMTITEFFIVYPGPLAGIALFFAFIFERAHTGLVNQSRKDSQVFFKMRVKLVDEVTGDPIEGLPVDYLGNSQWQVGGQFRID